MATGHKIKLPKATSVKNGKVKPIDTRPQPAKYAAKTKRTYRRAAK